MSNLKYIYKRLNYPYEEILITSNVESSEVCITPNISPQAVKQQVRNMGADLWCMSSRVQCKKSTSWFFKKRDENSNHTSKAMLQTASLNLTIQGHKSSSHLSSVPDWRNYDFQRTQHQYISTKKINKIKGSDISFIQEEEEKNTNRPTTKRNNWTSRFYNRIFAKEPFKKKI